MAVFLLTIAAALATAAVSVFAPDLRYLPDPALAICIGAAVVAKKDGDLTLALCVGLAAGLFSGGPWGLKALVALAAVSVVKFARTTARLDDIRERLPVVLIAAFLAVLIESLFAEASIGWWPTLSGLVTRPLLTAIAALIFLRVFEDGRLLERA